MKWAVQMSSDGTTYTLVTASVVLVTDSYHPDEGGAKFLRNVGSYKSHTALHPRRHHSAKLPKVWFRHAKVNSLVFTD
jgi:hypothetical protein